MYKDKDKQKEAVRNAVRKHRVLHKGITSDKVLQGMTQTVTPSAIVEAIQKKLASPNRVQHHPTCKCGICSIGKKG